MHINDGDLALLALGEGQVGDQEHLRSCSVCRAEVDSLSSVREIMAHGGPVPVEAPAYLWSAIEAAIAVDADAAEPVAGEETHVAAVPEPTDLGSRRAHRDATRAGSRGFYGVSLLGAAAVGAGIMWFGVSVLDDQDQQDKTIVANEGPTEEERVEPSIVASADLDALEDSVEPATAEIIEQDGRRVLRVDTGSLPAVDDGYLQVWLLEDDDPGMVTIGALTASGEEFILPDGLSIDTFTTVDVSIEHYDGNPEHSGESLWRGAITST